MSDKGKLIRAEQVAQIIGVHPRVAAEMMKQMPRINIGTSMTRPRWAVYESDVRAWLESRVVPADLPGARRTPRRTHIRSIRPSLLDDSGHIPMRR